MKLKRRNVQPSAGIRSNREAILVRKNCLPTNIHDRDKAIKDMRAAGIGFSSDNPANTTLMPVTLPRGWQIVESPEIGQPLYLVNEQRQGVAVIEFDTDGRPLLLVYGLDQDENQA